MFLTLLKSLLVASLYCQPVIRDLRAESAGDLTMRAATCMVIANGAAGRNLPVRLTLAVAWNESRFDYYAVSPVGAIGPLQAMPQYWCRAKPCNRIVAGLRALAYYLDRHPTYKVALARYNGCKSSCGRSKYARKVLKTAKRWSR